MKKLYSIGETAKIMGITVQALRNYSNLDIVKPEHVDERTGYRYYSFNQFYDIDRIVYLRKMGLSLPDIAKALHARDLDTIIQVLSNREIEYLKEIEHIYRQIDELKWYRHHFRYAQEERVYNVPYFQEIPERYILWQDYCHAPEITEKAIIEERNRKKYRYHRQWGFICNKKGWLNNQFIAEKEFTLINETVPEPLPPNIIKIPAGTYACVWTPRESIQVALMTETVYEKKLGSYVIALLYEENLSNYENTPYEFQILIKNKNINKMY